MHVTVLPHEITDFEYEVTARGRITLTVHAGDAQVNLGLDRGRIERLQGILARAIGALATPGPGVSAALAAPEELPPW